VPGPARREAEDTLAAERRARAGSAAVVSAPRLDRRAEQVRDEDGEACVGVAAREGGGRGEAQGRAHHDLAGSLVDERWSR
jgi:hypothetical protein